jgi:hypothetical protein
MQAHGGKRSLFPNLGVPRLTCRVNRLPYRSGVATLPQTQDPPPFSIEKHPMLPPTLLAYTLFSLYHILGRICSVARALVPYPFIVPRSTS